LKLSVKSDYAARAVLSLARRYDRNTPTRVEEIASENNVPANYLNQILIELKAHGIVRSIRGKEGGYQLARPPSEITLGDVLTCIYGPLLDAPALADPRCPVELQEAWRQLQSALRDAAQTVHFQKLLEGGGDSQRMFYI
jgi:Rrf2 family transcriptional regulator, cysteine metabolism repressor